MERRWTENSIRWFRILITLKPLREKFRPFSPSFSGTKPKLGSSGLVPLPILETCQSIGPGEHTPRPHTFTSFLWHED